MSRAEMKAAMTTLEEPLNEKQLDMLFGDLDKDQDGKLSREEFQR